VSSAPDPELRRVGGRCLVRKVRQLAREVTAIYDGALRPHGIKASQLNLLVAVGAMGEARPADLVGALSLEKSTVSRGADRLAEAHLLDAIGDGEGGGLVYRLSGQGRALLTRVLPDWRAAQAQTRELLGSDGVAALAAMTSRG
jgi:DNA-binding MarR family transcriptional regulator